MKRKVRIKKEERDAVFRQIPGWDVEKVRAARILVAGAGALGNEVLKNLALLNVKQIVVVDFDHIERSNLSRSVLFREADCEGGREKGLVAAERVREINPEIHFVSISGDVGVDAGLGIFRRMDAIIGCLDNRIARLHLNRMSYKTGKPWINGGILNLAGQIAVYMPGKACYECELTPNDWQHIRFRMGCTDIAQRNSMRGHVPTSPVAASIIGAMQVQEALKLVLGQEKESLAGRRFYYDGQHNVARYYGAMVPREDCLSHYAYDPVVEIGALSADCSLETTFSLLKAALGCDRVSIELDHSLLTGIATMKSKQSFDLVIPKPHFSEEIARKYRVIPGEEIGFPPGRIVDLLEDGFPHAHLSLRELGIPYLHILRVVTEKGRFFVELTGDSRYLEFREPVLQIPGPSGRNGRF